jgi:hypothetical protein
MAESKRVQAEKTEGFGALETAARAAYRTFTDGEKVQGDRMYRAGLATIEAIEAGALTFDRVPDSAVPGQHTRTTWAKVTKVSPTLVSKFRTIGALDRIGVTPTTHAADWGTVTKAAAAKWLTEATATGDRATVEKALADHREGAERSKQTNGATKGKKKAQPSAEKVTTPKVTKASIEADARRILAYLSAPTRVAALSVETVDTLRQYLTEAAEVCEAETHKRAAKGIVPDVATELVAVGQ